jgi:hypothetical protein
VEEAVAEEAVVAKAVVVVVAKAAVVVAVMVAVETVAEGAVEASVWSPQPRSQRNQFCDRPCNTLQ